MEMMVNFSSGLIFVVLDAVLISNNDLGYPHDLINSAASVTPFKTFLCRSNTVGFGVHGFYSKRLWTGSIHGQRLSGGMATALKPTFGVRTL